MRIRTKISISHILLVILALALLTVLIGVRVESLFMNNLKKELRSRASGIAAVISAGSYKTSDFQLLSRSLADRFGTRITFIDKTGKVLADSEKDPADMGDHSDRPEFQAALGGEFGESVRSSASVGRRMLYVAAPAEQLAGRQVIVRVSLPTTQVDESVRDIGAIAILSFLAVGAVATVSSLWLTRTFTGPIGKMTDLARTLASGRFSERASVKSSDELGELSSSLNKMADSVERLDAMRRDFIANVSHELKTPITGVKLLAETLIRAIEDDKEAAVRFAGRITTDMERLSRVVDDLLVLSSLEVSEPHREKRPVDLGEAAAEVVDSFQHLAAERGLDLSVFAGEQPVGVHGDIHLIRTLIENLVDNALKYTSEGSVRVGVEPGEGVVVLTVKDTGYGIPEPELARIFERFYRVDKDRSRATGGTGLGLSIVKHIAENHDAKVSVESKLGEGSEFRVAFPLVDSR